MCLVVKEGEKIRTARKNIVVWKLLDNCDCSPHRGFHYYKGRIYKPVPLTLIGMMVDSLRMIWVVNEGFHAYIKEIPPVFLSSHLKLVRMVIPKGSQYVLGLYDEIVSSHIRFPKKAE